MFAVAPVVTQEGVLGVPYGDCGPKGADVVVKQAQELQGLAMQMGMVISTILTCQ